MKYLGLPLSVWQLKRVDLQLLEDKMSGKFVTWDSQNMNAAGRGALIKSVYGSTDYPPYSSQHTAGMFY
jgi:hypothetical protein